MRTLAASLLVVAVILQGSFIINASEIRGMQTLACCGATCTHNGNTSDRECCRPLPHPVDLQVSGRQPNRGSDSLSAPLMHCPARLAIAATPIKFLTVTSERPPPLLPLNVLCSLQI